jgi:hypothetical protein
MHLAVFPTTTTLASPKHCCGGKRNKKRWEKEREIHFKKTKKRNLLESLD